MDWNTILTEVLKAAASLATLAVGIVLTTWLDAKKQKVQADKKSNELCNILGKAEDAVTTAVGAVNQTIVSGTKGTDAWTDAKKAEAYETAATTAMNILGESGVSALELAVGSVETWLKAKIEAAVGKTKKT